VLKQDQIRGRARDIGGAINGYSDVCRMERGSVIDAVAHEADNISEPLQRQQDPKLLLRIDAAEQVDPRQLPDQRFIREVYERVAREHSRDRHTDLGEDVPRHYATLSPLPLGLGSFEGTCTGLLHLMGGGLEASLAATLILRGLTLWLPMLPGLVMIRREAVKPAAVWSARWRSPMDEHRDLAMGEDFYRLAAEDERGDAMAAV
jgi:hypothetical protein